MSKLPRSCDAVRSDWWPVAPQRHLPDSEPHIGPPDLVWILASACCNAFGGTGQKQPVPYLSIGFLARSSSFLLTIRRLELFCWELTKSRSRTGDRQGWGSCKCAVRYAVRDHGHSAGLAPQ